MTTDQLDALLPGSLLFIPTDVDVGAFVFCGRATGDYYTLSHPPDADGVVKNKRPFYLHALDLMNAQTSEIEAWAVLQQQTKDRLASIDKRIEKLTEANEHA